jgi:hypothetical protein
MQAAASCRFAWNIRRNCAGALPEAAVALEETFVRRLHDQFGLGIEDVRRGYWWSGRRHDQDVVTAVPNR